MQYLQRKRAPRLRPLKDSLGVFQAVIEVFSPGPGRACCSTTAGSAGWPRVGHSEVVFATRAAGLPLLLRPAATLQRAPHKELSQFRVRMVLLRSDSSKFRNRITESAVRSLSVRVATARPAFRPILSRRSLIASRQPIAARQQFLTNGLSSPLAGVINTTNRPVAGGEIANGAAAVGLCSRRARFWITKLKTKCCSLLLDHVHAPE